MAYLLATAVTTAGAYPLFTWLGLTGAVAGLVRSHATNLGVLMASLTGSVRSATSLRGPPVAFLGNDCFGLDTGLLARPVPTLIAAPLEILFESI